MTLFTLCILYLFSLIMIVLTVMLSQQRNGRTNEMITAQDVLHGTLWIVYIPYIMMSYVYNEIDDRFL